MKFCIYTDPHFTQYSSLLRKRGKKYSVRLENLIDSINWVESLAVSAECDAVLVLGDFFDKPTLNAEELTALNDIRWANKPHMFLVGNHEAGTNTLEYSSSNILGLCPGLTVINSPQKYMMQDIELCVLPYIAESDRQSLSSYFGSPTSCKRLIVSHNDIAGIQFGAFKSVQGFDVEDIINNSSLFINGHLHNGEWIKPNRILNLGNLTGQNFSEDALKYNHVAAIVDTTTLSVQLIENPYAINFYKLDLTTTLFDFNTLKDVSVVTAKCLECDLLAVKQDISNCSKIIESRVIFESQQGVSAEADVSLLTVDHLKQFEEFILEKVGSTDLIKEEISFLFRG